ncbi:MAG TPA: 5-methyltetrahydropteroyltriglutamate--homocysteine S-methyltransferase [Sphingobacteriaceae bacterium]|nr:5-methyltetrahydropteroyltriglutamate--homocysteine S-methyltransferase [Sphingobacteriaceae bacterium]
MQTNILGYPRIGNNRALKKASEKYWSGELSAEELLETGQVIRRKNWELQKEIGVDLIPSNDFSFYDQVLDLSVTLGAIPDRYSDLLSQKNLNPLDLYFALARGYQKDGLDLTAMEMTKWFDTNYHYIVPEFYRNQHFKLFSSKIFNEFEEAKALGIVTKPVIIGPVSFLLLGKEKEEGFDKLDLLENLLPVYVELLQKLKSLGAVDVQIDEPFLCLDLTENEKQAFKSTYERFSAENLGLNILLTTYFDALGDNLSLASSLPVSTLHVDLVRAPEQLDSILNALPPTLNLSLGLVDGRNIWKNDLESSLNTLGKVIAVLGSERVIVGTSCSLLHSPCDLDLEQNDASLSPALKNWLAFAKQKVEEVILLKKLALKETSATDLDAYEANKKAIADRKTSTLIHNQAVKTRVENLDEGYATRQQPYAIRKKAQQDALNLPLFPTTTIGSFPQTTEVRTWRSQHKKGLLNDAQYDQLLKEETERTIRWQEEIGLDVLVHGEFERNDMVEYFGEQLEGFAFTRHGWVQSYGSRCVKPPIIFGDVSRPQPMTVYWSSYAQSLTAQHVKGMLTGPVTILQWSFVRDDQPRSSTCQQIALAIRDEVADLEKAGIRVIQIDEPAIREGLPLRQSEWADYLDWAIRAFRIASSPVQDSTQIHTHMCYSEFNDIIEHIAAMDADVITIECSRSQMELLDAFANFEYPNEIGPGVYDIHSPRVPAQDEITALLEKAAEVIPADQLWVNPDCGLKTRHWEETRKALIAMVAAAREARSILADGAVSLKDTVSSD